LVGGGEFGGNQIAPQALAHNADIHLLVSRENPFSKPQTT
jgi:hypothetical protein